MKQKMTRSTRLKRLAMACSTMVMILAAQGVYAQSSDAILDLLVRKGVISQREANDVREQLDKDSAVAAELYNKNKNPAWIEKIDWAGDLRVRAEFFDNDDQSSNIDRLRYRYRLRYGAKWKANEWATFGMLLASGGTDDPVSTNQTLTDTFRKKPITVDLAYVTLQPPGWDWLKVTAGKMENPIWQPKFLSPMQYDGDVTPEGLAEQFSFKLGDGGRHTVFANFGQYPVEEFSTNANDAYLFEFQTGWEGRFGGTDPKKPVVKATMALGYSTTDNLNVLAAGDSPNRGNATQTVSATGVFLDEFELLNIRGDLAWAIRERPFLGTPSVLSFGGEYITNLSNAYDDAVPAAIGESGQTDGYTFQIAFGEAKKRGEWQFAYQYKYLEADATWDAITDSDWGTGGTDRRGHVLGFNYNVRDWWQVGFKGFLTEKISSRPNGGHTVTGADGEDLLRIQLDTVFKF